MRFLIDMNVSAKVAEKLRGDGHDAVHLRELGLGELPDVDILARAATEQRIIVTYDLDFVDLVAASGGRAVSVIVFRLRRMSVPGVLQRLQAALRQSKPMLAGGAVVIVEEGRVRVRRLPIGS